jgi:hypothetical protein
MLQQTQVATVIQYYKYDIGILLKILNESSKNFIESKERRVFAKNPYPGSECGTRFLSSEFKKRPFEDVDFPEIILENFRDYGKKAVFQTNLEKR